MNYTQVKQVKFVQVTWYKMVATGKLDIHIQIVKVNCFSIPKNKLFPVKTCAQKNQRWFTKILLVQHMA